MEFLEICSKANLSLSRRGATERREGALVRRLDRAENCAALGLQPVEHEPLDHLRDVVARQLAVGLVVVDDDLLEEFRHPGVQPLAVDEDLGELVELREEEAEDRRRAEVHL